MDFYTPARRVKPIMAWQWIFFFFIGLRWNLFWCNKNATRKISMPVGMFFLRFPGVAVTDLARYFLLAFYSLLIRKSCFSFRIFDWGFYNFFVDIFYLCSPWGRCNWPSSMKIFIYIPCITDFQSTNLIFFFNFWFLRFLEFF